MHTLFEHMACWIDISILLGWIGLGIPISMMVWTKEAKQVKLNAVSFETVFDGCQLMQVRIPDDKSKVTFDFHYMKRYAKRLQLDEEREAKRLV